MPTLFQSATNSQQTKPPAKQSTVSRPLDIHKVASSPMKPLTSFAVNPEGIRFETQEEQETVILFLRQHVIVNVPWIIIAIVLLFAPTVLFPFVFSLFGLTIAIPTNYIVVGTIWWYVATFGFILAKFLGWFIDIYIVTNQRVVDIDFYYLLYKHFGEAELAKIQDISYTAGGIFAAVFNYGDVTIETAGEAPNLVFEKVPHPEQVVETIRELTEDQPSSSI